MMTKMTMTFGQYFFYLKVDHDHVQTSGEFSNKKYNNVSGSIITPSLGLEYHVLDGKVHVWMLPLPAIRFCVLLVQDFQSIYEKSMEVGIACTSGIEERILAVSTSWLWEAPSDMY